MRRREDSFEEELKVTDINMPQLRQPMTLQDKCLQECVNLYCGACERWISKLYTAARSSKRAYRSTSRSVSNECSEIQRSLSELPFLLIVMMSPQLTRKFADMIDKYNDKFSQLTPRFKNEEKHNSLCTAMFRSVLTPYLYKYDKETLKNYFTMNLILQTVDSVPGLRSLRLVSLVSPEVNSPQFVSMIYRLRHLQVFTYMFHCTDEVIEQLGLHCHHLKEIDVRHSRRVTNASALHLLQLRKLEFLNLDETQIDDEHYGLLLSELPIIKHIEFRLTQENILDHVAEENLHKILHVSGHVEDVSMLAQRCRNITNLDIWPFTTNLSGLAALTTLRTVRISGGDFAKSNLNAVLTGIGPTLTDLTLDSTVHVNLQDIVTLCPSLAALSLFECTLLPLDPNTPLDPQLPHFRNLISLKIEKRYNDESIYNYIRHYVSLKTIRLDWINIFTVEFMREVVTSGTLANLEEFYVREYWPGALTMEALELLIGHCSHLKIIESLGMCPLFDPNVIEELKRGLLVQNLDLEII